MKKIGDHNDVVKLIAPIIGCHTIQLFKLIDGVPQLHGTGVLIAANQKHFLISAAHCLEKEEIDKIVIPVDEDKLEKIGSRGLLRTSILTSREDDKIDLVICQLLSKKKIIQLENTFNFLNFEQIELNHKVIEGSLSYFVMGFPSVRTKTDEKNRIIENNGLAFLPKCSESNYYEKYGFTKDDSVLVDYPKRIENINNQNLKERSAEPYGVSGGGLWKLNEHVIINSNRNQYKLIGILIEFQKRTGRVMIATKANYIIAAIQQLLSMNLKLKD